MILEHFLQFGPDGTVARLVFLLGSGMDRHHESFADFHNFDITIPLLLFSSVNTPTSPR
jgi:hypothetical protein